VSQENQVDDNIIHKYTHMVILKVMTAPAKQTVKQPPSNL
jgi:hypothetical protein